ncbi:NADH dehydrogenase [ubiquinone] 1 alpha subcomplex subunit 1 [Ctenocephalides felis]|uniref:NADH dehydrogenase [ubiquinone] 1 alpha subcomplex subunit 1 n=1 Tax=Ctenocephalides felis TaxID=7515 RepID=UPI000E6E3D1E|nr:NADH dehydrogenase [ubiquinone] 1 alpha subcomplex subunit 1 [Ctenocephalides felis]
MWFEILPSFGIIVGALALPSFASYHMHKLVNGNPYLRDLNNRYQRRLYQRDQMLTKDPYVSNGLEVIPDE